VAAAMAINLNVWVLGSASKPGEGRVAGSLEEITKSFESLKTKDCGLFSSPKM
jgi:hypothetical protein